MAVIGRQDGRFLDNAKHFFLQADAQESALRFVYVTERPGVVRMVREFGLQSMHYPSLRSVWFLLRCGSAVVDEASWYRRFRFFLLLGAQVVQLWHGVGFKWIEAALWKHQTGQFTWFSHPFVLRLRIGAYHLTGRRMRYTVVLATSRFYCDEVFKPAFISQVFLISGYPRNDFAQSLVGKHLDLAWSNVDRSVRKHLLEWRTARRRLVLVAPTFRDTGGAPMHLDEITLAEIESFAERQEVEFIFKFHPSEQNSDRIAGRHFHVCAKDSDVYPLLPYVAALVTDYSSISMDFLLMDKPLCFLIPEDDDYITRDRQLQFDPRSMMPGPVVSTWQALLGALDAQWNHDDYAAERAALRAKAFDDLPQSESVPKLLTMMRDEGWLAGRGGM